MPNLCMDLIILDLRTLHSVLEPTDHIIYISYVTFYRLL